MDNNIHKEHRQRVKKRYLSDGIGAMADHNIIELLLFYGVPYKDTNLIAHELIEKFGDINGVIDASVDDLIKINGVGENTATLIHLLHDIIMKYNENTIKQGIDAGVNNNYKDILNMKYMGETREIVYMLCIDSHGTVKRTVKIAEGSPDKATVNNRTIVESALRQDSKNIIISHNHPNGFAVPSVADVQATKAIVPLLNSIDVTLTDHIIVAPDGCFSMAKSKKYAELFG